MKTETRALKNLAKHVRELRKKKRWTQNNVPNKLKLLLRILVALNAEPETPQ
jgi:hypothetical protein